jgi:hypothetical protein
MKANIVCLKWGTKYGVEYVNKLFAAVKRNTTIPFDFHCFTEDPTDIHEDVIIHPLKFDKNVDGWWNKLYLFSDEIDIDGRILFIDLDTLITDNIDAMLEIKEGFVMIRDFFYPLQDNDGSGLMSFETKQHPEIWNTFIANPEAAVRELHPHGDQKWIVKFVDKITHWQTIMPEKVVSFKIHCGKGLPEKAAVVCYHGRPSVPESITTASNFQGKFVPPSPWVKNYWRE